MKKIVLIILSLFSLVACISSIDDIKGATKVGDRVKVYIDNLSNQNVIATLEINNLNPVTFGGITIAQNTTGGFIEVDFTKDTKAQNKEIYSIALLLTTICNVIKNSTMNIVF